jgi:ribonuclease BN (tRNA processing enzyme)
MIGKFIKKSPAKKPKMVNKKTQTKKIKVKIKRSASLTKSKSELKKKSSKPGKKGKKNKKNDSSKTQSRKKNKTGNKSSKSSISTSPFRTLSLGGRSLIFKTDTQNSDQMYLAKSVNNFNEHQKSKSGKFL